MLYYSRVGRKGEPPAWVDSRTVLNQALDIFRPMIAEVKAEIHIEGDWPRVLVSPDEMLRMLQNLIGNALKFRVAQRLPLITINSTVNKPSTAAPGEAGTLWPICIADNGVGMATEAPAGASA